ncbi:MAG: hypothetical protein QXV69_08465 [Sulfolobaceae archaeon]
MNIDYLNYKLSMLKNETDFSKLKEEDSRLTLAIDKLNRSIELIDNIKQLLQELRKFVKELYKVDPKVEEEYKFILSDLKGILNYNDPEVIYLKLDEIYNKLIKNLKYFKDLKVKYLDNIKSEIRLINQKLLIYQKIYIKIINKEIDIKFFSEELDNVEDLLRIREEALNKLKELHYLTVQELKSISDMNEEELELIIQLLDKGEIKINKRNINKVIKVIKLLIEKGLNLQVKL